MKLNPQCQSLLDFMDASFASLDTSTLTASEMRARVDASVSAFASGDEVASIENISIDGPGGPLRLRFYRPIGDFDVLPATLYFHGGGFVCGAVEGHDNVCRTLAQRAQTLVVSVDYRLAPEAKFPAATHDALASLEWLLANVKELGIDPGRVAVCGDSAGGNLAAVIAQQARSRALPICHQLLFYPLTDCRMDSESYTANGEGYLLTKDLSQWFMHQYLPDESCASDPTASPLRQPDLRGVAPATIVTAGFDPLRDDGRAYAKALEAAGIPVVLREWGDQIHGFASMLGLLEGATEALDFGAKVLREAFAPAQTD